MKQIKQKEASKMKDSQYDANGLISNSNDDLDLGVKHSENIQFKPLDISTSDLDAGLDDDFDLDFDVDDDLNWQPNLDPSIGPNLASVSQNIHDYAVDMNDTANTALANNQVPSATNSVNPQIPTQSQNTVSPGLQMAQAPSMQNTQPSVMPAQPTQNTQVTQMTVPDPVPDKASTEPIAPAIKPESASQPPTPSEMKQKTQVSQKIAPKEETLASGTTVIWPSGSHIKMSKNAHPVQKTTEPVKSKEEIIQEAREAASYFKTPENTDDDIKLDPNNKASLTINHATPALPKKPSTEKAQQTIAQALQKSEGQQTEWAPITKPQQATRPLLQASAHQAASVGKATTPDVKQKVTFSIKPAEDDDDITAEPVGFPDPPIKKQTGSSAPSEPASVDHLVSDDLKEIQNIEADDNAQDLEPIDDKLEKDADSVQVENINDAISNNVQEIAPTDNSLQENIPIATEINQKPVQAITPNDNQVQTNAPINENELESVNEDETAANNVKTSDNVQTLEPDDDFLITADNQSTAKNTDANGLIENSQDFVAGSTVSDQSVPVNTKPVQHLSLEEAIKQPYSNLQSQINNSDNTDDFYNGMDEVVADPDSYERRDFVDLDPNTHELNITHAFRKKKAQA